MLETDHATHLTAVEDLAKSMGRLGPGGAGFGR